MMALAAHPKPNVGAETAADAEVVGAEDQAADMEAEAVDAAEEVEAVASTSMASTAAIMSAISAPTNLTQWALRGVAWCTSAGEAAANTERSVGAATDNHNSKGVATADAGILMIAMCSRHRLKTDANTTYKSRRGR